MQRSEVSAVDVGVNDESQALSVGDVAEALERLRLSEAIREEVGIFHTYPLREQDEEIVTSFYEAVGELPPLGFVRRLLWYVRLRAKLGAGES